MCVCVCVCVCVRVSVLQEDTIFNLLLKTDSRVLAHTPMRVYRCGISLDTGTVVFLIKHIQHCMLRELKVHVLIFISTLDTRYMYTVHEFHCLVHIACG